MINRDYVDEFKSPVRRIKGKVEVYSSTSTEPYETYLPSDKLKSISIKRVGENGKFFGFGIPQEATVELLDNERSLSFEKDDMFRISFKLNENPYENPFPDFYIADIKRDEKTNQITLTLQDKLFAAARHTVSELGLTAPYTPRDVANACAVFFGYEFVVKNHIDARCFYTEYPHGANFDGTETIREVLNAIAEATQTIYYISGNSLVFRMLASFASYRYVMSKSEYFSLEAKEPISLDNICHTTELGDNVVSSLGYEGDRIQYVRNNPFWELREDIADLVDYAFANIDGTHNIITPFTCSWRGNFLVEVGDAIHPYVKDNSTTITTFLINDTITYNGGYKQDSNWSYQQQVETPANPASIGEAIKQTYARVDKVNKQIDIVASETAENKESISALQIKTDNINLSVSNVQKNLDSAVEATNKDMAELESRVNANIETSASETEAKINLVASNVSTVQKNLDDAVSAADKDMADLETRVNANIAASASDTEAKIDLAVGNVQKNLDEAVAATGEDMTELESRVNANITLAADEADAAIEVVASKADANEVAISALQVNTGSISASVSKVEKTLSDNQEAVNDEIAEIKKQVDAQITPSDVTLAIQNEMAKGTNKVITSTGFTFNEEGLTVSKSNSEISTTITEDGMKVKKDDKEVLTANNEGVKAVDLHATTYLIIGKNSRFEDYGNRTACFWIGGNS